VSTRTTEGFCAAVPKAVAAIPAKRYNDSFINRGTAAKLLEFTARISPLL
jgi:hypothetical protein